MCAWYHMLLSCFFCRPFATVQNATHAEDRLGRLTVMANVYVIGSGVFFSPMTVQVMS